MSYVETKLIGRRVRAIEFEIRAPWWPFNGAAEAEVVGVYIDSGPVLIVRADGGQVGTVLVENVLVLPEGS